MEVVVLVLVLVLVGFMGVFVLVESVGKRRDLGWESEGKSWLG